MTASPEDPAYVAALIERTPLLPEARLRAHWRTLLPWLTVAERYALAATLVHVEQRLRARPNSTEDVPHSGRTSIM